MADDKIRNIGFKEMGLLKEIYPFPVNLIINNTIMKIIDILNDMGLADVLNNRLNIELVNGSKPEKEEDIENMDKIRIDFIMALIISITKDKELRQSFIHALNNYKRLILSGETPVKTDLDNIPPFREN